MKMQVVNIITGIVLLAGTFFLLGFSMESNSRTPVNDLVVSVDQRDGIQFIDEQQIRAMVKKFMEARKDSLAGNIQLRELEQLIAGLPHVQRAHAYRTIDGSIHIKTSQKKPLLRVITSHNDSYYIDTNGGMIPLSGRYTARVMVATGHIHNPYSAVVNLKEEVSSKKNQDNEKRLRELFQLVEYINQDTFWNAIIDHIYVTPKGEFELIPKNGNHIVEFGKIDRMEQKFTKLYSFYQHGLSRVGWHHYSRVNLKFNNQIVCSK
ncbi:MAG: hypothetical protein R6U64_04540 [Bacteroidales bacterium]